MHLFLEFFAYCIPLFESVCPEFYSIPFYRCWTVLKYESNNKKISSETSQNKIMKIVELLGNDMDIEVTSWECYQSCSEHFNWGESSYRILTREQLKLWNLEFKCLYNMQIAFRQRQKSIIPVKRWIQNTHQHVLTLCHTTHVTCFGISVAKYIN